MAEGSDQRDSTTWVVLELTRAGEAKVEEGTLPHLLREALGVGRDYPVFLPSVTYCARGRNITLHLMEGYAFVASGLPETVYLNLEGTCPYVRKVLSSRSPSGMRALNVIPDTSVQDMRRKLAEQVSSDIVEGMHVVVTDGTYTHLDGHVIEIDGAEAHVRFTMRSLDLIARVPRVFLTPSDEEVG